MFLFLTLLFLIIGLIGIFVYEEKAFAKFNKEVYQEAEIYNQKDDFRRETTRGDD